LRTEDATQEDEAAAPAPRRILLVEDDPGHSRLIERNLRRSGISNRIVAADSGRKALDYIFGGENESRFSDRLLVLLDLNMPDIGGYEVLKRMKEDERTRHIPVVILTSTDDDREVSKCYELGCNNYVTKPVEYAEFVEAIRKLGLFLSVVKIPF